MFQKIIAGLLCVLMSIGSSFALSIDMSMIETDIAQERSALGQYSEYADRLEDLIPALPEARVTTINNKLMPYYGMIEGERGALINYAYLLTLKALNSSDEDLMMLSDSEIAQASEQIALFESHVQEALVGIIDNTINAITNMSHVKESGDLSMSFELAAENFMEMKGEIELNDYVSETHMFDSTFQGELKAFYDASMMGEEISMSINADLELISVGGNIYIQVKNGDFESSDEFTKISVNPFLEKLADYAKNDTYVALMDEFDAAMTAEVLDAFRGANYSAEIENFFSAPLLEAYGKSGEMYMIRPTQHFCNAGKSLMGVFDPFSGPECSASQYQDFLQGFKESGVKMMMDTSTTQAQMMITFQDVDADGKIEFLWNGEEITAMSMDVVNPYGEEEMRMSYDNEDGIDIFMNIDEFQMMFDIDLGSDWSISKIDGSMTAGEMMEAQLIYANKTLDFDMSVNAEDGTSVVCMADGTIKANYSDIKGRCDVYAPMLAFFLGAGKDRFEIDMDMLLDTRSGKNNIDLTMSGSIDENNYGSFNIKNNGRRVNISPKTITAPENIIDMDSFIMEVEEELYGDLYDDDFYYDFENDSYYY